jgi:hypothetical protein
MAGRVIPFPNRSPQDEQPEASLACALCGVEDYLGPGYECGRCGVSMHGECYWGRIASLEEWKVYIKRFVEINDEFKPNVICAACRQGEKRER